MTAPTEAEIRAAVKAALADSSADIGELIYEISVPIAYHPEDIDRAAPADDASGLWTNLRHSEAVRLAELREAIYRQADAWETELLGKITEAVVQAALTFASEYPDAPRAVREAVEA